MYHICKIHPEALTSIKWICRWVCDFFCKCEDVYILSDSHDNSLVTHLLLSLQISMKCYYYCVFNVCSLAVQPTRFCLHPEVHSLTWTSLSRLQMFCCCSNSWIVASCRCWPSPCFGLFTTRPAGNNTTARKHIMLKFRKFISLDDTYCTCIFSRLCCLKEK